MARDGSPAGQKGALRGRFRDRRYRALVSLCGSFGLNTLYALWETGCGLWYHSFWFVTLGCNYALLVVLRGILLLELRSIRSGRAQRRGTFRACGILLLGMNLILVGVVVLVLLAGEGTHYAGYLIYAIALYTFLRVGVAIRNLVQFGKLKIPALSAAKDISFASAVVSVLSMEIALCLQFGTRGNFFNITTVCTGLGACVLISAAAVHMMTLPGKGRNRL